MALTALHDPVTGRFTVSTSIGSPAEPFNIRRTPRVSLFFSEPTGSGLDAQPTVPVRAVATCPDEVVATPPRRPPATARDPPAARSASSTLRGPRPLGT